MTIRNTLLFLLGILAASSCSEQEPKQVAFDVSVLRDGDLLFRTGAGMQSHAVTSLSQGRFSHVGIAYRDSVGIWMVVHAVPGESPQDEPDYLKSEKIEEFYSPFRAVAAGYARVDCSDSIAHEAVRYALQKVDDRVQFDHNYSLSDTTQMYCTELVWHAFLACSIDISEGRRNKPLLGQEDVLFPSDLIGAHTTLHVW